MALDDSWLQWLLGAAATAFSGISLHLYSKFDKLQEKQDGFEDKFWKEQMLMKEEIAKTAFNISLANARMVTRDDMDKAMDKVLDGIDRRFNKIESLIERR